MKKTLTSYYKNYSMKPKNNRTKIIISLISAFLIIVFLVVAISVSASKTKIYSAKYFYFVYAGKYTVSSKASEISTKVSDKGGAGIIYKIGNTQFVVVSSYFSESDAKKIKEQIISSFVEADVLKITAPKLSKSVCNSIEKQSTCKLYYNTYYNFCKSLYSWCIQTDTGEISASEVYKKIMKVKQEFSNISNKLKTQTDSISKAMYDSSLLAIEQISSFFDSAFISNNVAKYIKKLYINSIIEFVDMCETIK